MIRARIDRWFARFRQHGDARLLASVFDHSAPELWRVAVHLCRDRHDAEDAVQSTFLAAIESKHAWDGERPLLPWLVGLLVNRAREQRRARLRVVDASRLVEREVVDPATAAGERELGASFAAALRDVSEPFRSVVERHFVHGLDAAEIAAATGVPAATVRTRLHRGLEQLRQKLPAGAVAGSLVPLHMPAESLAAVREAVLAKVPGGAAVAVGSGAAVLSWFGVLALHKVLFGVAAAGVGLAAWWIADSSSTPRADTAGNGDPAAAAVASTGSAAFPTVGTTSATTGNEPSAGERIEAPPLDAAGTLSVLVRNGATKVPLADVQVHLTHETQHEHSATGAHSSAAPVPSSVATAADAPESADGRTDEAGRVALRIAAGRVRVSIVAGVPGPGDLVIVTPGTTTEYVRDVPAGFTADVLVVDAGGMPVRDAVILALGPRSREMSAVGRTDVAGRWRDQRVDPLQLVRAVHDAHAASPVEVADQGGTLTLKLGGAAATIHGLVMDAAGAPVPSAVVVFVADGVIGRRNQELTVRTDAQGRYRCQWLEPGGYDILVSDLRHPRDRRVLTSHATAASGDGPATELRFDAGVALLVRLRRHGGQPVGVQVELARNATEIHPAFVPYCNFDGMTDAEGMLTLRGLLPGHYLLTARHYQATVRREIELREGQSMFQHTFGELCSLQIEVVDEHEQPRADIRVLRKVSEREWTGLTTDAKGQVRFEQLEKGEYTVALAANEKGLRQSLHSVSTDRVARLVMPMAVASGRVVGRVVVPREELPKQIRLMLVRDVVDNPFRPEQVDVTLDAGSGAFHCADLPAGRYHFAAFAMEPVARLALRANIEVSATGVTDLGTIELGSGEITVDVRLAGGDPGKVHAAVAMPGTDFFAAEPLQASDARPIRRQLPAGAWRVMVWGENVLPAFADATVAIDQVTPLAVDVQPGVRTEVRLPGSIGMMTVHFPDGSVVRELVLELRSWVRGLAPGNYRVEYTDSSSERYTAEFPVGTAPGGAIELRLAAR